MGKLKQNIEQLQQVFGPKTTLQKSTLLYNEFIVYDPQQVKQRFLVQVKFNFRSDNAF